MKHGSKTMIRRPIGAAIALAAAMVAGGLLAAAPAEARDYPYCLTSPGYGYPGDCSYATYNQCRVAASGGWRIAASIRACPSANRAAGITEPMAEIAGKARSGLSHF